MMKEIIVAIFKTFNHIARELQIYFLSGFLILANIRVIDHFVYDSVIWKNVNFSPFIIPLIVLLGYVWGNISMAFLDLLVNRKGKYYGFNNTPDEKCLPVLLKKDKIIYHYFIERYSALVEMRFNLSGALIINGIVNAVYTFKLDDCHLKFGFLFFTFLCFVSSFLLYYLSTITEKDYSRKIDAVKEAVNGTTEI